MALNDPAAMGALAALDSKDARKGVLVYGIDGAPEGKKLIKEGMMTGTAAQSPKQMADTAINAAYQIFDGKKVTKEKSNFCLYDHQEEYRTDRYQQMAVKRG